MQLELRDNLPFIMVQVSYRNTTLAIPSVLVDTGSATSILSADQVAAIDIQPAAEDRLYTLRGTGGNEVVFAKQLETLQAGEKLVFDFDEKRHDKQKWIQRIYVDPSNSLKAGSVEFEDGDVVDLNNPDWKKIKPLIWW